MIFLHTEKEPVHDYVRQALLSCSQLVFSGMIVVFRVAEIFFSLSPYLREEDEQGNHVGDDYQAHGDVLDAPDEIDFS